MLVVMAAVSRAVAQEDRSPALGFARTTRRELLGAGCGHAATNEPGALAGKGRAGCADPEPDRYSQCFVLPVKGALAVRYNRRYQLQTMIPRFVHSAARTQPMPYRLLIAG